MLEVWTWSTPLKSFPVFRSEPHILVPCFSTLDTKAQTFPKVNRRKLERCFFFKGDTFRNENIELFSFTKPTCLNKLVFINNYILVPNCQSPTRE